jgi:tetratricopeptide (TPR) repeat protein
MVEQRQLAERQRQLGNAAFKAGQFSEALRCYEAGLDAQRHSMALHANAALAALKLGCHVQALEHCDKVGVCFCACRARYARSCAHARAPVSHVAADVARAVLLLLLLLLLQVLHLAEVLHHTREHPLCVKALQRRAAAHQVGMGASTRGTCTQRVLAAISADPGACLWCARCCCPAGPGAAQQGRGRPAGSRPHAAW